MLTREEFQALYADGYDYPENLLWNLESSKADYWFYRQEMSGKTVLANIAHGQGDLNTAVLRLIEGAVYADLAMQADIGYQWDPGHDFLAVASFYMGMYYGGIDWLAIVDAWAEAPTMGRIFTIGAIDHMRREIWDEPLYSFAFKSATSWQ